MDINKQPQGGEETSSKKRFLKNFLPAVALALGISFLLMLYGPLELYFTNIWEFPFSFSALFPEVIKMFLLMAVAGLVGFGICYMLHIRLYHALLVFGLIGYICTYIQGMFLSGNLPPLDGTSIDWSQYLSQHIISVVLWVVVAALVILLVRRIHMEKMYSVITGCALFFSAILLVTVVTVCIQNDGLMEKSDVIMTKDGEFDMSTDQNLVIFVVDAMDSATFQDMYQSDHPEFGEMLEDFTYYPDTVGAYTFTQESIPFILTGKWYENETYFYEYAAQAMDESPLFSKLESQNYRMGVYEDDLSYKNGNVYRFENAKRLPYTIASFKALAWEELKLVWFKYAPFPLKPLGTVSMQAFSNLLGLPDGNDIYQAWNSDVYPDIQNTEITKVDDKCFRFIHIEGAHVPFRYDKDVNVIDSSEGSYKQNMEASMTIVNAYLEMLKEAGVYDNTAIVLMADHGYNDDNSSPWLGRSNPFLAVKGIGEQHDFEVSGAPISYDDLQVAYQRLIDGASSDQVFDAQEGDERARRYLCYKYTEEYHMEEYLQQGHATNMETIVPTGKVYDR